MFYFLKPIFNNQLFAFLFDTDYTICNLNNTSVLHIFIICVKCPFLTVFIIAALCTVFQSR